eukprot:3151549-Pleurochrysis_carterae.AAC.1
MQAGSSAGSSHGDANGEARDVRQPLRASRSNLRQRRLLPVANERQRGPVQLVAGEHKQKPLSHTPCGAHSSLLSHAPPPGTTGELASSIVGVR